MTRPRPIADRLAERLVEDPTTGCVNWTGSTQHNGYGRIGAGKKGKHVPAHRVAYELAKGPVPPGLQIDHLCRNRRCCNPAHLEAVTYEENMARGNAPQVLNARKTHCVHGHPFNEENTMHITVRGRPARNCRTCYEAHLERARQKRTARSLLSRMGGKT
jgi:hypothetical protein